MAIFTLSILKVVNKINHKGDCTNGYRASSIRNKRNSGF